MAGTTLLCAEARAESDGYALESGPIVKWCAPNGTRTVYSDVAPAGYQKCGEITPRVSCDPVGNRFISTSQSPYSYKDCSVGRRMYVAGTVATQDGGRFIPGEGYIANGLKASVDSSSSSSNDYFKSLDKLLDGGKPAKQGKSKGSSDQLKLDDIQALIQAALQNYSQLSELGKSE